MHVYDIDDYWVFAGPGPVGHGQAHYAVRTLPKPADTCSNWSTYTLPGFETLMVLDPARLLGDDEVAYDWIGVEYAAIMAALDERWPHRMDGECPAAVLVSSVPFDLPWLPRLGQQVEAGDTPEDHDVGVVLDVYARTAEGDDGTVEVWCEVGWGAGVKTDTPIASVREVL